MDAQLRAAISDRELVLQILLGAPGQIRLGERQARGARACRCFFRRILAV